MDLMLSDKMSFVQLIFPSDLLIGSLLIYEVLDSFNSKILWKASDDTNFRNHLSGLKTCGLWLFDQACTIGRANGGGIHQAEEI